MKPSLSFVAGNKSRLLLLAAIATGVLGMQAGRGTLAYFTTQVVSGGNTFTAGTLQFQGGDFGHAVNTVPLNSSISFGPTMKPGDIVYAPLEIDNVGSLAANYTINYSTTTTGTKDLTPALDLQIVGRGAGSGTLLAGSCNAADFGAAPGGLVWKELIAAISPMIPATLPAQTRVLTTPAALPLTAGPAVTATSSDVLCMKITFHDNGKPATMITGDNLFNNLVIGKTETTIAFTFDGLVSDALVTKVD